MNVSVFNEQTALPINEKLVIMQVKNFLEKEKTLSDEVAVYFVDAETISQLHDQFFNDPSVTDCISLHYDSPAKTKDSYCFLGEVFICTEIAISYAKTLENVTPIEEATRYLIHGLLHLIGYDDIKEEDSILMKAKEEEHLLSLKENHLLYSPKTPPPLGS